MELPEEITSDLLRRLARIEGQVRGVQALLRDGRGCREVVTQLSAVGKAIDQVGFKMLSTCLTNPELARASGVGLDELERLFLKLA